MNGLIALPPILAYGLMIIVAVKVPDGWFNAGSWFLAWLFASAVWIICAVVYLGEVK